MGDRKGVADEVVLVLVVSAEEEQRKRPSGFGAIACGGPLRAFVREVVLGDVPTAKVPIELEFRLLGEVCQHRFDTDLNERPVFGLVAPAMKIVFVDDWPPLKALRTQH